MTNSGQRTLLNRVVVGVALGVVFLLSLLRPELVVALVVVVAVMGTWELSTAMRSSGWYVPRWPASVAAAAIVISAYVFGVAGQWLAAVVSVAMLAVFRLLQLLVNGPQPLKRTLRDFGSAAFVVIYVPLMASFLVLINAISTPLLFGVVFTVAMIDTFGFFVGRVLGRTKFAPAVSPKKSVEGLLASAAGALLGGFVTVLVTGAPFWIAPVFAAALMLSAVLGDLSESLIKRDLGVKDMGDGLPGHGGWMDRMDSMLPSAFVGYLMALYLF